VFGIKDDSCLYVLALGTATSDQELQNIVNLQPGGSSHIFSN